MTKRDHPSTEATPLLSLTEFTGDTYVVQLGINVHDEVVLEDGQTAINPRLRAFDYMTMLSAPLTGAGSVYSTFGPIAIYYQPGLWLLGPVAGGAVISLTDATFTHLVRKYPESPLLNKLKEHSSKITGAGLGYLAEVGFHWSVLKTTAIFIAGVQYDTNTFAKLIAPLVSLVPAVMTTSIKYKQNKGELIERSHYRHIASALRGFAALGPLFSILTLNTEILKPDSPIPFVTNICVGILGLTASLCQESHPAIGRAILAFMKILAENASLSALSFALLNDIYASTHDWDVSDEFFYTNLAINSVYYIILTVITVGIIINPEQVHNEDEENTRPQGSIEELDDDTAAALVNDGEAVSDTESGVDEAEPPAQTRQRRHSFGGFWFHDRREARSPIGNSPGSDKDAQPDDTPRDRPHSR